MVLVAVFVFRVVFAGYKFAITDRGAKGSSDYAIRRRSFKPLLSGGTYCIYVLRGMEEDVFSLCFWR